MLNLVCPDLGECQYGCARSGWRELGARLKPLQNQHFLYSKIIPELLVV